MGTAWLLPTVTGHLFPSYRDDCAGCLGSAPASYCADPGIEACWAQLPGCGEDNCSQCVTSIGQCERLGRLPSPTPASQAPPLWATAALTGVQALLLVALMGRFTAIMELCRRAEGPYRDNPGVKATLLLLLYLYVPLSLICITFGWVSYREGWAAGWLFVWLPFASPLLFAVVAATSDEIGCLRCTKSRRVVSSLGHGDGLLV